MWNYCFRSNIAELNSSAFFFFSEFPFCTLSIEWLLLIPSTFLSLLPLPCSLSWVKVQSSIVQFISTIRPLLLHLWVGFSSSVPGIRLDRANTELLWWKHTGKMSLVHTGRTRVFHVKQPKFSGRSRHGKLSRTHLVSFSYSLSPQGLLLTERTDRSCLSHVAS